LFLLFCAVVASLLLLRAPVPAIFGMLIVLLGLPLHRALRRRLTTPSVLAPERIPTSIFPNMSPASAVPSPSGRRRQSR
jgi:hypothetical protein